jgi:hypothetical protein
MANIYYDPKEFGLEILSEIEPKDLSYEFEMFVVWRDPKSRELFYAQDSGCSCPTPFEDFRDRDSLTRIDRANLEQFEQEVMSWNKGSDYYRVPIDEKQKLISAVRRHMPRKSQPARA